MVYNYLDCKDWWAKRQVVRIHRVFHLCGNLVCKQITIHVLHWARETNAWYILYVPKTSGADGKREGSLLYFLR